MTRQLTTQDEPETHVEFRLKVTLARDVGQAMDREIRACSDRSFAEVTGRPGTDAELRRFYRAFRKALSDDAAQRRQLQLASIRERNELIREQYRQLKREADTPPPWGA